MPTINLEMTGLDEILKGIDQAGARVKSSVAEGLTSEARLLAADAAVHCPVKTGELRDSHYSTPAVVRDNRVTATAGFSDWKAAFVNARFKGMTSRSGEPHWLKEATLRAKPNFTDRLAARIRALLGG